MSDQTASEQHNQSDQARDTSNALEREAVELLERLLDVLSQTRTNPLAPIPDHHLVNALKKPTPGNVAAAREMIKMRVSEHLR